MLAMLALVAWLMPATALADSYSQLWRQYTRAADKDQPRTQLALLRKIAAKASTERAYGHLLKAQLIQVNVWQELSPDSLQPAVRRLEQAYHKAAGGNEVLAGVYASALGHAYDVFPQLADDEAGARAQSLAWYDRSMACPDALAKAYATGYEPFVVDGVDSRFFGDDLLHIIGFQAGRTQFLHQYYEKAGNRPASCLTALKLLRRRRPQTVSQLRKSTYLLSVDSLLNAYQDLQVAGEVAIERYNIMAEANDVEPKEMMAFIDYSLVHWGAWPRMNILRNAQSRLTLPSFHVSVGADVLLPGRPYTVQLLRVCNVGELTMTVRRLNVDGDTQLNPADDRDYAKLKTRLSADVAFSQTRRYIGIPAYKVTRDSMTLSPLPVGVYLAEFTTNNAAVRPERMLLRVSNLSVVYEPLPDHKVRFAVLDATTGLPVSGAALRVAYNDYGDRRDGQKTLTLTCDTNGEAVLNDTVRGGWRTYYAYTPADKALPFHRWYNGYYGTSLGNATEPCVNLFTDRAIYRPGQTVQLSAIAFNKGRKGSSVCEGEKVSISLSDANGKELKTVDVVTDAYGTAATSFVLPATGLTGRFSLSATMGDGKARARVGVRVEEYKRPTFDITFDKPSARYQAGDTLTVDAQARTFGGMAVQGAKVLYRVVRRPALWWGRSSLRDRMVILYTDSTTTDLNGAFKARVPLLMPDRDDDDVARLSRFYTFEVSAVVTEAGGESHEASLSVPLGDKPTALTCDLPDKIERDSLRAVRFSYLNAAGQPVDGTVTFYIDDQRFTTPANVACVLPSATLSSASHLLTAYCGNDTISRHFTVFAMDDKRVATHTHDWFYASARRFPADGSPVYVQVGSSDSVQHVLYTIFSGRQMLENGVLSLKDGEVSTRQLTYKPEYGDGLLLTCVWVKEGQVYRHTATIACPQPDTRLRTSWSTFRDRLTPGQKEEWTLHITAPDGKAAKAQAMLTMYDKSLDQLVKHRWTINNSWKTYLPSTRWYAADRSSLSVYGEMAFRPLGERNLAFSYFNFPFMRARDEMFVPLAGGALYRNSAAYPESELRSVTGKVFYTMEKASSADALPMGAMAKKMYATAAPMTSGAEADGGDDEAGAIGSDVALRQNFTETAFFMPAVETDTKGNVKVKFTLPESVTTWRLMGLAHDALMNTAHIEAEAVAQKQLMVETNLPRFVRTGDKGVIMARLSNTAGRDIRGTARLELLHPDTRKVVFQLAVPFQVTADATATLAFPFDMGKVPNDGLLVCRVTAQGNGFSDGEQRWLPVLAASQLVTTSASFTQQGAGVKSVDLQPLFAGNDAQKQRLVVEYTNHPAWLMVQTLPSVSSPRDNDAVSLATAYYATAMGRRLMALSPVIGQTVEQWRMGAGKQQKSALALNDDVKDILLDETPWVASAEDESEQMQRLASFYDANTLDGQCGAWLAKLQQLQRFEGSFGWWPGMDGNAYVTLSVAEMLVRLSACGVQDASASQVLDKAIGWLGGEMARECNDMRQREQKGEKRVVPSAAAASYLYVCSLTGARQKMTLKRQTDFDYLVRHLARQNGDLDIEAKAQAAVVMARNGRKAEAMTLIESMRQYLVSKPGMGSYYDTRKASYSWRDYRIPTQVAAIEAISLVQPADTATVAAMQLWLLQSKRTQGWDTPLNTVDAVSAFLAGDARALTADGAKAATLKVDGRQMEQPRLMAGLGYVKATKEAGAMCTFTAEKHTDGLSWGAVYAQSVLPVENVRKASEGLAVERHFYKDGQRLASLDGLKVGDRITVRIDVTADRDYDFVSVADHRAACMEPTSQLSGYRDGCYVSTRDHATYFHFDRLSKGRHTVQASYYIDRIGTYRSGLCTVQCAYSPEFAGRDKAVEMVCK